jgi:hypothetical protein
VASGTLIAESLRLDVALDATPLDVRRITRLGPLDTVSKGQPAIWTFIEFVLADEQAPALAVVLSEVLDPDLGWYCDYRTEEETFVVFSGRTFRYLRGDAEGREQAASHARAAGLPDSQIDWPE